MPKDVLSDKRISAKMITFGLPYGRSAAGLAPQLGVSKEEAQGYIDSYFAKFPVLKQWIDKQRQRGVDEQMIVSVFGRRRRFPLITDRAHKKEVERQAGNMAIQSAINDLTLLAYVHSIDEIRKRGIPIGAPCNPGAHIHDSINLSVPIPFWVEAVDIVREQMNKPQFESKVKFPAEVEVGYRWGHMITVITKKNTWAVLDPKDETIMPWLRRTIPVEVIQPDPLEVLAEPDFAIPSDVKKPKDRGGRNI
jgi:DNA polymerase I